jgi:hypothetical protein
MAATGRPTKLDDLTSKRIVDASKERRERVTTTRALAMAITRSSLHPGS